MSKITQQPIKTRQVNKERHRAVLLDSAAEAVNRYGVRGATVARIHEISGLSRGMISLHFGSKEHLLLAMLRELAKEYTCNWRKAFDPDDNDPARRLRAMIEADFSPEVLNRRNITIWFAFRADVGSHPEYRPYVDSRETAFREAMLKACHELTGSKEDARLAADVLIAMLEGMWTDFLLNESQFNREKALQSCLFAVKRLFPMIDEERWEQDRDE